MTSTGLWGMLQQQSCIDKLIFGSRYYIVASMAKDFEGLSVKPKRHKAQSL